MHTPTPARPPSGGVWPQKLKSKGQPTSGRSHKPTSGQADEATSNKQQATSKKIKGWVPPTSSSLGCGVMSH